MIALARVADRGPLTAAALAAGLLLAALAIPTLLLSGGLYSLFIYVGILSMAALVASAAVVAFVALRRGEIAALRVAGGCTLLTLVPVLIFPEIMQGPLVAFVCWLSAIVAAIVLARTSRLDYAMLVAAGCGVVAILLMVLVVGNTTEVLTERFSEAEAKISAEVATSNERARTSATNEGEGTISEASVPELTEELRESVIKLMVYIMTGAIGVTVMSVAAGALFLARGWQADLVNKGGFQKEFHALSLGRNAALFAMFVIALAMSIGGQIMVAVAMVATFAFFFQGLAIVHALVKQHGMHRFWLYGTYMLMVSLMLPALLLAALGFADNISSLRRSEEK